MNIFKIRMGKCWCHRHTTGHGYLEVWLFGRLYEVFRYRGRAKIATLRFEKIARFSQNQDKMQKNENLTVFEAAAADAVLYADALLEELEKTEKKL